MFCIDAAFWTAHIPPNDRPQIKTFIFSEWSALKCVLVEEKQWEQTAKQKHTNKHIILKYCIYINLFSGTCEVF